MGRPGVDDEDANDWHEAEHGVETGPYQIGMLIIEEVMNHLIHIALVRIFLKAHAIE